MAERPQCICSMWSGRSLERAAKISPTCAARTPPRSLPEGHRRREKQPQKESTKRRLAQRQTLSSTDVRKRMLTSTS